MTRRRTLAAILAAGVVGAGAAAALSSGEGGPADGSLEWRGTPQLVRVPELPRDRVLAGEIRNTSARELRLDADAVELLDADGHALPSTARFAAGFGHGLYSPTAPPAEVAELEQRRLGEIVTLEAGASAPLTLSWRLRGHGARPVVARVDGITLRLPRGR